MSELGKYTPSEKPSIERYETAGNGGVSYGHIKWQPRYAIKIPFDNQEVAYEVLGRVEEMLQRLIKRENT